MYEQDYIMREIKHAINMILRILFKKRDTLNTLFLVEDNLNPLAENICKKITKLCEKNNYSQAEDLLFCNANQADMDVLKVGLYFYDLINNVDEEVLQKNNFSHDEIKNGLNDLLDIYDLHLPLFMTSYTDDDKTKF